jgi:hypothetical protein
MRPVGRDQLLSPVSAPWNGSANEAKVRVKLLAQACQPGDGILSSPSFDPQHDLAVRRELDGCSHQFRAATREVEKAERSPGSGESSLNRVGQREGRLPVERLLEPSRDVAWGSHDDVGGGAIERAQHQLLISSVFGSRTIDEPCQKPLQGIGAAMRRDHPHIPAIRFGHRPMICPRIQSVCGNVTPKGEPCLGRVLGVGYATESVGPVGIAVALCLIG